MQGFQRTVLRGLALANFALLLGGFLLYRAGRLNEYLPGASAARPGSPNGGTIAPAPTDSARRAQERQRLRAASSKSIVVTDGAPPALLPLPDTGRQVRQRQQQAEQERQRLRRLSSSKSMVVMDEQLQQQLMRQLQKPADTTMAKRKAKRQSQRQP